MGSRRRGLSRKSLQYISSVHDLGDGGLSPVGAGATTSTSKAWIPIRTRGFEENLMGGFLWVAENMSHEFEAFFRHQLGGRGNFNAIRVGLFHQGGV